MNEHICFKKLKRIRSNENLFDYGNNIAQKQRSDSIELNYSSDSSISSEKNNKDENDITEILNNINKLNIDNSNELFTKILKKISELEKKVETLCMVNIKIDTLKKDIDKILVEKDYVIENLKYEINDLKYQLKESKYESDSISCKKINDYYS